MAAASGDCSFVNVIWTLIVSALLFYSTRIVPAFIRLILQLRPGRANPNLLGLKTKVGELRVEMAQISPVDEFAKFARKQREVAKISAEIHSIETTQLSSSFKFRMVATVICYGLLILLALNTTYRLWNSPVFQLPNAWLKPFDGLHVWPLITADSGGNCQLSVVFTFGLFWRFFGLLSR